MVINLADEIARRKAQAAHTKKRLWVPALFWDDHNTRCPGHPDAFEPSPNDIADQIRIAGKRVLIEGTARQLETLRADAAYYADQDGPDLVHPALPRSAKATLVALKKAGV